MLLTIPVLLYQLLFVAILSLASRFGRVALAINRRVPGLDRDPSLLHSAGDAANRCHRRDDSGPLSASRTKRDESTQRSGARLTRSGKLRQCAGVRPRNGPAILRTIQTWRVRPLFAPFQIRWQNAGADASLHTSGRVCEVVQ
jgi:hypothetical protein